MLTRTKIMRILAIIFSLVGLDQLLKYFATQSLLPSVGGFFGPIHCNPNLAWSLEINSTLFTFLWIIFIIFFLYFAKQNNWHYSLLLVLSGAISNIIDRLIHGCVIDFINIGNFPTFNFADICISFGIVLFLIQSYSKKPQ